VRRSAGILMFRHSGRKPMVLLVHPGGPFWRNKDRDSWSIPKGEFGDDETAEAAAVREFEEETGFRPAGALLPLGEAIQAGGKRGRVRVCGTRNVAGRALSAGGRAVNRPAHIAMRPLRQKSRQFGDHSASRLQ
jgi:predicted NUDIX family NTP pyrophosphohydrolase